MAWPSNLTPKPPFKVSCSQTKGSYFAAGPLVALTVTPASSFNPYESPRQADVPRRARAAHPRILKVAIWAGASLLLLASANGLFEFVLVYHNLYDGRKNIFGLFPTPPLWLALLCYHTMPFFTAAAIAFLPLLWGRIPKGLWLVIVPTIVFDIWVSAYCVYWLMNRYWWSA